MAKCSRETHPKLFGYLDAYGLDNGIIAAVDRIKENGHYCLVGALINGQVHMLDMSKSPDRMQKDYRDGSSMAGYGYNMLNDGMEWISEKDWNKVKLDAYCDTFTISGNKDYE